jgi:6-pyruvoyltetrahydropterin/6-carboxytetrahydropterin synthase
MAPEKYNESYRAHIRKEALKFASAHMTVFPDGSKEALHGHNYRTEVSIDLRTIVLEQMISFDVFKSAMKQICDAWDEKVLLAKNCPFFKIIASSAKELEFTLCGKRYVLPADEVVLIERDNVTTETLSAEFCKQLIQKLDPELIGSVILGLEVRIEEMTGQGASTFWKAESSASGK